VKYSTLLAKPLYTPQGTIMAPLFELSTPTESLFYSQINVYKTKPYHSLCVIYVILFFICEWRWNSSFLFAYSGDRFVFRLAACTTSPPFIFPLPLFPSWCLFANLFTRQFSMYFLVFIYRFWRLKLFKTYYKVKSSNLMCCSLYGETLFSAVLLVESDINSVGRWQWKSFK